MKLPTVLIALLLMPVLGLAETTVDTLRSEERENPEGLGITTPQLSWVIASSTRGDAQTAYQVLVASSPDSLAADRGDLWDSGKVPSASPLHIAYAGKPLESRQRCFWKVRIWDHTGQPSPWSAVAEWSMGLLKDSDWQARWISDPILADSANRPLTPIHCYRSALADRPDAVKWIVLDLGAAKKLDSLDLLAARPEKLNHDFRTMMFPLRFRVEAANAPDFSDAQMIVDQTSADVPSPRVQRVHFDFPVVSARFVRLTVTRLARWDAQDYGVAFGGFQVFEGQDQVSLNAKVDCSDSLETELWSKQLLVNGKGDVAIAPDAPALAVNLPGVPAAHTVSRVPMLRRDFALPGKIRRAVLSISARGFYEVHINGARVGNELLAPGYTSYNQRLQYQTHDVTALLQAGENCIGALLGYGWYAGHMNLAEVRCIDGTFPQFLAQLDVELADGKKLTIATDDGWRSTLQGPVRFSDLLDGEAQDCRLEMPGWDRPGFDAQSWSKVWSQPRDETPLVWQRCPPVRAIQEMRPLTSKEVRPGVYVYDFGQEITGWCRLQVNGPAGTHITVRHAEMIDPAGNVDMKNLWGVAQQDDYVLDGAGKRMLEPHFTYHGFRYVEVSGLAEPPTSETVLAVNVHSDLPEAATFECSNPLYNRLMKAALWTQRNMLFDVPAGCAARGERLAWLGDIRPCVQSACFNFDSASFFSKYAQDIRDAQKADGRYCDITPHGHLRGAEICVGSAGWADAGVSLPWQNYVNYGNLRDLAEHFESAKRWVDYVAEHNPDFIWKNARGRNDWGDWLSAGTPTPKELGATAFFAHSADLVARMSTALNQTDDAARYGKLFADIKRAFAQKYVFSEGVISLVPGSEDGKLAQGNYALALMFGLLDEPVKTEAVAHLRDALRAAEGHPTIGFWSTAGLLVALSENGAHAEAARMLNLNTAPSWGYMVEHGTTFWESFYADKKNLSLNHWTHSSVAEWLWRDVAGLNPDEHRPGYASFVIRPQPCAEVTWCRAKYRSVRGPIAVDWRQEEKRFLLKLTVPVSGAATVYLPAKDAAAVRENDRPITEVEGVKVLRQLDGEVELEVASGTYEFEVERGLDL